MRIYLLRHGTAEPRTESGADRPDRRLVARGRRQAALVGALLGGMGARCDRVISSPYARARETAEAVLESLPSAPQLEICNALAPDGRPQQAVEAILGSGNHDVVLAIGHEPQLSSVAANLIDAQGTRLALRKGGLVELQLLSISPPRAELLGLLRPRHLRSRIAGSARASDDRP